GDSDPLLRMEGVALGLAAPPAQERGLDREERAGAVEGRVGAVEEPGAGAKEGAVGVGAPGARAPRTARDSAVGDLMDGLNRCENAKRLEPGKVFFPYQLDVFDPRGNRKG